MIPQIPEVNTANKSTDEIVKELVKAVNMLNQQVRLALQNIDAGDVVTDLGVSLSELLGSDAFKGEDGAQGPPGRVYRPAVSAEGLLSWNLTDEGGSTPAPTNVRGPAGVGIPAGGGAGQVLAKASAEDYDFVWVDQATV